MSMMLLVAFTAIIIPLILIVLLRVPARYSMPISALAVALLGSSVWGMSGWILSASTLQGVHRALTIIWILVGAIFFLYVMQQTGAMQRIKQGLFRISTDMRIQVVLVAFAFVAIIEGVSGFGTPAAIAVPLLLALGFHPLSSVVLALVGDSVPTSFGALATPLTVGLSNVSNGNDGLLREVASRLVVLDAVFALILPVVLVTILVVAFGRKRERRKDIAAVLPWSLLMGATYVVAAYISNHLAGFEFTSVFAGGVTLLVGVLTARNNILQPKTPWRHHALDGDKKVVHEKPTMSLVKAWLPYVLIVGILLAQRMIPELKALSTTFMDLSWERILAVPQISSQWFVLYSPGTTLMVVALATGLLFKNRLRVLLTAGEQTVRTVVATGVALISTLIMVQIFANSGLNHAGLQSIPVYIAEALAHTLGPVWLAVAPFLGMLAAFIMGSSTISTLTMSPVQYSVATQLHIPLDMAMAQQVSGANAGNMIAIHNVVAASAVSGLHHQEGRIIRHTLPIAFLYLACTIVVSVVFLSI